jgi:hypothetical protein
MKNNAFPIKWQSLIAIDGKNVSFATKKSLVGLTSGLERIKDCSINVLGLYNHLFFGSIFKPSLSS